MFLKKHLTPGSEKNKDQRKQKKKEEIAIWNDKRTHRQKQLART